MGAFINKASSTAGVDPNLLAWIQAAAANSPYDVAIQSGKREGDPRFHGKGMAIDVQLIDPKTGKVVPNYQTPASFQAYQNFANQVRGVQMASNPDARLRWGGYFSGGKGKYGALDLMHFDTGDVGMAGGGWDTGLTAEQAAIWGLQPGGGYTGTGTIAPAFADAVAPPTWFDPDYGRGPEKFDLGGLGAGAAQRQAARRRQPVEPLREQAQQQPANYVPGQSPEVPLAAQAVAPAGLPSPLAELFKVGDIGTAGAASAAAAAARPYAPPRRREV